MHVGEDASGVYGIAVADPVSQDEFKWYRILLEQSVQVRNPVTLVDGYPSSSVDRTPALLDAQKQLDEESVTCGRLTQLVKDCDADGVN